MDHESEINTERADKAELPTCILVDTERQGQVVSQNGTIHRG